MSKITVQNNEINILNKDMGSYISITDMLRSKDGEFFVSDWLRNRNTIEFLGLWESIYNPNFNYGEFAIIRNKAGLNNYKISVKQWCEKTKAIGIESFQGRYGGTYAHEDIAMEFASWISVEFKLYLIKEFQRLKKREQESLGWDIKRNLAKINYKIHTEAVRNNLIPHRLSNKQINQIYANEADVLNVALFGITAKEWKEKNPNKKGNIRDYANVDELVCLSNLENINSVYINDGFKQKDRLIKLNEIAISQMKILADSHTKLLRINNIK